MIITLVTGGKGLVGKGLEAAVKLDANPQEEFIYLSSADGDLRNMLQVKKLFNKYKPTKVIHMAANVGGLFKNMNKKLDIFESNMKMNENVLKCCLEFGVKKCVSCLTISMFPNNANYPIDESMLHDGLPHESHFGYAMAKRYVDVMNRIYNSIQSVTLFTSVILCNIYGPYDNFNLADAHVVPALIHHAYLAKKNNEPYVLFGSGSSLRQFIYSIDLGKLLLKILREYESPDPIIFAPDEQDEISIKRIAEIVLKEFEIVEPLKFDLSKSDGKLKTTVSNAKLRSLYPDFKFTSIEQGLSETVKWFKENYSNARK